MKHFFLVLILAIYPGFFLRAQTWEWIQTAGSEKEVNVGTAVTTDPAGNVYLTGYHHAPFHLHQDVRSNRSLQLISSPRRDDHMFVAKYDANGNLRWANYALGDFAEGIAIAADAAGNVFVTGRFSARTKFSSTDGDHIRMDGFAPGLMFLAKYDAQGRLKWVVKGGSMTGRNAGQAVVLSGGHILVAGYSEVIPGEDLVFRSADYTERSYSPFKGTKETKPVIGLVVTYDQLGRLVNTRFWGSPDAKVYFHDLKIDYRDHYYLAGTFEGHFKAGNRNFETEALRSDGIVLAYDTRDQLRWDLQVEATFTPNSPPRLALERNKLAIAFAAKGKGRLFKSSGTPWVFGNDNLWEASLMLAGLDLEGNVLWQEAHPVELGTAGLHDLEYDDAGQLYLAGHYSEELRLGESLMRSGARQLALEGTSTDDATFSDEPADRNLFIACLNNRGKPEWMLGTEAGRYEVAYGIAVAKSRHVYTTGYFNGGHNTRFGDAPLREFGKVNVFLARINPFRKEGEIQYPALTRESEPFTYTSETSTQYTRGSTGKQKIFRQEITVANPKLELYIWDNHQIDGDVVSLYLNDSCILKSLVLQGQSKFLQITLPTDSASHLMIVAENIGEISPNTTALVVVDGLTRQRVHLQSDMYRSEVLTIHCKGKAEISAIEAPATSTHISTQPRTLPQATMRQKPASEPEPVAEEPLVGVKEKKKPFWKFWKRKK